MTQPTAHPIQAESTAPSEQDHDAAAAEITHDQDDATTESTPRRSAPVHRLGYGRLQASIWRNELRDGSVNYTVTLRRSYTDAGGVWRDSTSFGRDDLLVIAKLASEAHSVIHGLQRRARERGQDETKSGQRDKGDGQQDQEPAPANGNTAQHDATRNGRATSDAATRKAAAAGKAQRQR